MKPLSVAFCLLAYVRFAAAQSGSLTGKVQTVTDSTPIPKATIRAKNLSTGSLLSAVSGADGTYTIPSLPPGRYEISAEFPPLFLPFRRDNVEIRAENPLRFDIRMSDVQLNTLGDGGDRFVDMTAEQAAPAGPTPRTADGKPDFTGVWLAALSKPDGPAAEPLAWAEELVKERRANFAKDSPMVHCLPGGTSYLGIFFPYRLVQTPKLLVVISDVGDPVRQIYLDGRPHPKDPNPTYMGHSVGHWEGDTLIVDTVGFNDRTWLTLANYPQSEKLHVVERFRRPDLGHLQIELTLEDPDVFKRPWKLKKIHSLAPEDTEVQEYVCAENERDTGHFGKK